MSKKIIVLCFFLSSSFSDLVSVEPEKNSETAQLATVAIASGVTFFGTGMALREALPASSSGTKPTFWAALAYCTHWYAHNNQLTLSQNICAQRIGEGIGTLCFLKVLVNDVRSFI